MLPSSSLHYVYHHCTVTEGVLVVALLAEVLTLRMSSVREVKGSGCVRVGRVLSKDLL